MSGTTEQAHVKVHVKVLVGFASEFKDQPDPTGRNDYKLVPILKAPGCETAFITMAISRELFEGTVESRAQLAEVIVDAVAHKIRQLISKVPGRSP